MRESPAWVPALETESCWRPSSPKCSNPSSSAWTLWPSKRSGTRPISAPASARSVPEGLGWWRSAGWIRPFGTSPARRRACRSTSCWAASAWTRWRSMPPHCIPRDPGRGGEAEKLAERGFHGIKIKVGFDLARDIEIVSAVRSALGPDFPLMTDANMGYGLDVALAAAEAFEKLGIGWLEEPLFMEDVAGHAQLKAHTGVPVALGENLTPVSRSSRSWPATPWTCSNPTCPRRRHRRSARHRRSGRRTRPAGFPPHLRRRRRPGREPALGHRPGEQLGDGIRLQRKPAP